MSKKDVISFYPTPSKIIFDEQKVERKIGYYKYSDGTLKSVYEIEYEANPQNSPVIANGIEKLLDAVCIRKYSDKSNVSDSLLFYSAGLYNAVMFRLLANGDLKNEDVSPKYYSAGNVIGTIRYIKLNDNEETNMDAKNIVNFSSENDNILFDEQATERQIGWYRYNDGSMKPVYEMEFFDKDPKLRPILKTGVEKFLNAVIQRKYSSAANVSDTIVLDGCYEFNNIFFRLTSNDEIKLENPSSSYSGGVCKGTIRYTKVSDTAIT